jgi:GalNAc-alpha-(1->4)-GalNAc-alpha-(1->3)-diNAcBac-PP-undecaprenol alpha-1,4-N-acetyl-D-galactosaminyltransferase
MQFLNRYRCRIADRVLPKATGIRVVSERVKASLLARYGTRIPAPSVIPITVDTVTPPPVPFPEHSFKFALIAVCRLEAEKRVEDILAALQIVLVRYPMVGLFIAGAGRERARLEHKAQALGGRVVFLGDRPDARALMASAQAFVQASAYEGYGRTLIEAALAKVPIITTDVGIVGDVFKDGEDLLAVPVASPVALAHAIMKIIGDNEIRQGLPFHAEVVAREHLAAQGDLPDRIAKDLDQTLRRA